MAKKEYEAPVLQDPMVQEVLIVITVNSFFSWACSCWMTCGSLCIRLLLLLWNRIVIGALTVANP